MATVNLLASTVMDAAASLMNDTAKTTYTYVAQLPYLRIALQELQVHFELNAISCTETVSGIILVNAGTTDISFPASIPSNLNLPADMIVPQQVWERPRGIDPWTPMRRVEYLPHNLEGVLISQFLVYVWQNNMISVLAANQNNDIKIDYIKDLFTLPSSSTDPINVINGKTFLEYRTAGLLAEFIERNLTSAQALNAYAELGIDRATGIEVKGKQAINTRRRPFRSGYKRSGGLFSR